MHRVLFEGPGAGSLPTTSAVVADALDAAVSISSRRLLAASSRARSRLRRDADRRSDDALLPAHRRRRPAGRAGAHRDGALGDAEHQHRVGDPEGRRGERHGGDCDHDARCARGRDAARRLRRSARWMASAGVEQMLRVAHDDEDPPASRAAASTRQLAAGPGRPAEGAAGRTQQQNDQSRRRR